MTKCIIEGPNTGTFRGVPCLFYLAYDESSETKGYVYYHADSQEYIGSTNNITVRSNGNRLRPAKF